MEMFVTGDVVPTISVDKSNPTVSNVSTGAGTPGIFSKSSVYYPFIIGLLIIIAINIAVAIIILSMYIINLMRKKKQSTPVNLTSPKMLSNIRATFGTMPSTAGNSVGGPVSLLSKYTSQVDLEEVKNHMRRTHRPSINDSSPMSGRRFSFKEKVHRSMEMMDKLDRRMSLISGGASHDSVVT
ncbi:hypothetical protein EB796_000806 [Bugula neritina]|uniref:Uncharacterized protein n=1 Tax=Bugula neritina TaxID=10212 RepID=A0A7J7KRS3_BUGNE|nr:hypothetical protein EB796_000806 [Bugula neritina]